VSPFRSGVTAFYRGGPRHQLFQSLWLGFCVKERKRKRGEGRDATISRKSTNSGVIFDRGERKEKDPLTLYPQTPRKIQFSFGAPPRLRDLGRKKGEGGKRKWGEGTPRSGSFSSIESLSPVCSCTVEASRPKKKKKRGKRKGTSR